MATINLEKKIEMVVWECPSCGVPYAISKEFAGQKRDSGGGYYCPNGHWLSWREDEKDRLKKQLAQKEKELLSTARSLEWEQSNSSRLRGRLNATERSRIALKGVLTKTRKRLQGGVCPCCNRTFQSLAEHMKKEHPNYSTTAVPGEELPADTPEVPDPKSAPAIEPTIPKTEIKGDLITVAQAAEIAGVSVPAIYKAIHDRRLKRHGSNPYCLHRSEVTSYWPNRRK